MIVLRLWTQWSKWKTIGEKGEEWNWGTVGLNKVFCTVKHGLQKNWKFLNPILTHESFIKSCILQCQVKVCFNLLVLSWNNRKYTKSVKIFELFACVNHINQKGSYNWNKLKIMIRCDGSECKAEGAESKGPDFKRLLKQEQLINFYLALVWLLWSLS